MVLFEFPKPLPLLAYLFFHDVFVNVMFNQFIFTLDVGESQFTDLITLAIMSHALPLNTLKLKEKV